MKEGIRLSTWVRNQWQAGSIDALSNPTFGTSPEMVSESLLEGLMHFIDP